METIKIIFQTIWDAVSKNLVSVVKDYPYSAGVLVLIGWSVPKLVGWGWGIFF